MLFVSIEYFYVSKFQCNILLFVDANICVLFDITIKLLNKFFTKINLMRNRLIFSCLWMVFCLKYIFLLNYVFFFFCS